MSDGGIRSIGNSCHALTKIDISHAKLISDVGVASISLGCPKLTHFACHGLYLLADPRISAPKKGEALEAWQAVVGIAAVAENCKKLEFLDLSGCFRMNVALQRHISEMKMLRVINFSGCNQSTTEALVAVAENCILLEDVNFSDCGKSVNYLTLQALTRSCKFLKVLCLARCKQLNGPAISAIAHCNKLEKLDLSGCKSLTDIMMLPICEPESVPLLKTLSLVNIPKITDTTLAWIASKSQDIMLLAVKGSSISKHSITAVRDRFPSSDMLQNDNFMGFWPKHRIEDQKLINKYYFAKEGWIKIQARQRSFLARVRVAGIVEKRIKKKAVAVLQRMARLFRAINIVYYKRIERNKIIKAAVKITSIFRIAVARKLVQRRHEDIIRFFRVRRALKIQVIWRMHRDKNYRLLLLERKRARLRRRIFCVTKIQSIGRVYFAKNRILRIKAMRRARLVVMERKALVIQRCFRGGKGRSRAKAARKLREWLTVLRVNAAKKIQKRVRFMQTREIIRIKQKYRRFRLICVVRIQSLIRGALARLWVAQMRVGDREVLLDKAAGIIQNRWRVKKAMLLVKRIRFERTILFYQQSKAAIKIETLVRSKLARNLFKLMQIAHIEMLKQRVGLEMWAIVKIQCVFRGFRGRMYFDQVLRDKKGKWKELYDEDKKRRFFYNKTTGEIRWRMPQDLLDLIPRPQCDNCLFYEAGLECAICNEVYCQQCWDQIHYGGRRKDHDFRSLYDYYGKRLDYGDGIFPSKWPTEVIQDEVQGWMLRVAPIRETRLRC